MTNIEKLNRGLELLDKAKQRKIGYEKWNKQAIWFSSYEQESKVKTATAMIVRLQSYCVHLCRVIADNV